MRYCKGHIQRSGWTSLFVIGLMMAGLSQISPGPLSKPHSHLEGINSCTECHTLGEKVSNEKCLECHQFLKQRVDRGLGYHASIEVRGRDCFQCHSEHHGLKFEMIRFDESNFNHDLTGYQLQGAHKKIDCNDCHKDENIIDYEIRDKEYTFLGLTTECLLCHEDEHRNTLPANCSKCHTFDAFVPASNFDHNESNFPLRGRHEQVDCASCHVADNEGSPSAPVYRGLSYSSCESCHDDVHDSRLGDDCRACHHERSFQAFTGGRGFAHGRTRFPLRGAHSRMDCKDCHDLTANYQTVFSDHGLADFGQCATCHKDVHEGRFGSDCRQCHTENSFKVDNMSADFNHALTDFPLEGRHASLACTECHSEEMTEAVAHGRCLDCHSDYHRGQLTDNGTIKDCRDCHSVYGFDDVLYSFEDHAQTSFPLEGGHLATPCFLCHLDENEVWQFDLAHQYCVDCHDNIHDGLIQTDYLGESCTNCHNVEMWSDVSFDHNRTNFKLKGRHEQVACSSCHLDDSGRPFAEAQKFNTLEGECYVCHLDIHRGQFEREEFTDCRRCHDEQRWKPSHFDHDSAAFVLDGAHIQVACDQCHIPVLVNGVKFVNFSMTSFECIDCHQ